MSPKTQLRVEPINTNKKDMSNIPYDHLKYEMHRVHDAIDTK